MALSYSEDMTDFQNRRSAPRINHLMSVKYVRPGQAVRGGQALNISSTGARLVLPAEDNHDPEFTVEFEGQLALLARQVWEEPLPGGQRLVGVQFEGFHWGQRVALDNLLDQIEFRAA